MTRFKGIDDNKGPCQDGMTSSETCLRLGKTARRHGRAATLEGKDEGNKVCRDRNAAAAHSTQWLAVFVSGVLLTTGRALTWRRPQRGLAIHQAHSCRASPHGLGNAGGTLATYTRGRRDVVV
ncbi:hypothetical protein MTO96_013572 [Rhipicephalus appendiculatus]